MTGVSACGGRIGLLPGPASRVALVARGTAICVAANLRVVAVGGGLRMRMAVDATEFGLIGGVQMALTARKFVGAAADRKRGVIEDRTGPSLSRVASPAVRAETGTGVVGVGRLLEIHQVTICARGGEPGIHASLMTVRAGESGVAVCQWECAGMVELRAFPPGRGVAGDAVRIKASARVIGLGRLLIIDQVATDAGRRHRRVNTRFVTLRTCNPCVAGGEWEQRSVVEFRTGPA
jgi:hypothetical protein